MEDRTYQTEAADDAAVEVQTPEPAEAAAEPAVTQPVTHEGPERAGSDQPAAEPEAAGETTAGDAPAEPAAAVEELRNEPTAAELPSGPAPETLSAEAEEPALEAERELRNEPTPQPDEAAEAGAPAADEPLPAPELRNEPTAGDAGAAEPQEADEAPATASADGPAPEDEGSIPGATEPEVASAEQLALRPAAPSETELAQLCAQVEAIVYVTEEPVTAAQIASVVGRTEGDVKQVIERLISGYAAPDRGIFIREIAGGYKMATKPEHHEVLRTFAKSLKPPLKLSLAALETLATIAYKQPITAPEIMEIRGVQGAGVLKTLLDRKLIQTAGRKNVIGKPILYRTSKEFLLQFGLKDLSELPTLKEFEELRRLAVSETDEVAPPEAEAAAPQAAAEPQPVEAEAGTEAQAAAEAPPPESDQPEAAAQSEAQAESDPENAVAPEEASSEEPATEPVAPSEEIEPAVEPQATENNVPGATPEDPR